MTPIEAARLFLTDTATANERWHLPFPMGVFGTLRTGQWNNHRMHVGEVADTYKAFMPHFIARGLGISFNRDSSAPFEIFCYSPQQWKKMIGGVDLLEGFNPRRQPSEYGYYRTLAWLHVLPEDFEHRLFRKVRLDATRDLRIPPAEWGKYERVPCWIYSSLHENKLAAETGTIIWG